MVALDIDLGTLARVWITVGEPGYQITPLQTA